jgi:hypothetical protein
VVSLLPSADVPSDSSPGAEIADMVSDIKRRADSIANVSSFTRPDISTELCANNKTNNRSLPRTNWIANISDVSPLSSADAPSDSSPDVEADSTAHVSSFTRPDISTRLCANTKTNNSSFPRTNWADDVSDVSPLSSADVPSDSFQGAEIADIVADINAYTVAIICNDRRSGSAAGSGPH